MDRSDVTLKRIEGTEIGLIPDLQETSWIARFSFEEGAPTYYIKNTRGGELSVLIPAPQMTENIGHLKLSNPAGGRGDVLCDLSSPMPWKW